MALGVIVNILIVLLLRHLCMMVITLRLLHLD